jgi:hypothetical protein
MKEMLRIRNNGTIHEIKIPSEQLEVVQRIVSPNVSQIVKEAIIKRLSGGRCCICGAIATQMVTYDASDEKQPARRIERYCQSCLNKVYEREPTL